ncbi:hypothetical protein F383_30281 [Gossypium arboreum]|uniref:Uncharacterized protein n=1 Tax=Gossypium arboreum TaxID=29729 RepID=A0A0B0NNV5_GOSAR|nr:hypothetical protein F383_13671 [Gossypium arboreum]KHG14292.1 hypothetical protein F383_02225 [Gossypium arboreum]KHG23629.1 hypothetical protein F383_30281 [Gossypium arboreum]
MFPPFSISLKKELNPQQLFMIF